MIMIDQKLFKLFHPVQRMTQQAAINTAQRIQFQLLTQPRIIAVALQLLPQTDAQKKQ